MAIINLTALDDIFDDADTSNTINGLAGADDIEGRGGDDVLNGGDGNDYLKGDGGDTYTGPSGNDTLNGGAGNDVLRGGAGRDSFNGGTGIDRVSFFSRAATAGVRANLATGSIANDGFGNSETMIYIEALGGGTAFVDYFTGNGAANFIIGGIGDVIAGGGGNDTFELDGAPATLDGGSGVDTITGFTRRALVPDGTDADTLADIVVAPRGVSVDLSLGRILDDGYGNSGSLVSIENVTGGDLDDDIVGADNANVLDGGDGDDDIQGRGGADTLHGGDGDDFLMGDGDDAYKGPSGNDVLNGGAGDDVLRGGAGVDRFDGGEGYDDRVSFFSRAATQGVVANLATGSISNDGFGNAETMVGVEGLGGGTAFADTFIGNELANTIIAGIGDTVRGMGGDDVFELEGATATLDGGEGNDTLESFSGKAMVRDNNGDGLADDIVATLGVVVNLATGTFTDGFGNTATLTNIENVGGSLLADTLTGDANINNLQGFDGSDVLSGGGGNDVLDGGSGRDRLDGGAGADLMLGGRGSDTYVVNSSGDRVVEVSRIEGSSDTVEASISYTLGLYVEKLVLIGGGAINGTGNGLNNSITGNGAANSLNGGSGIDTLNGGLGNDTLAGGAGGDLFLFNSALNALSNVDRITDFSVADDTFQLDNDVFTAAGAVGMLSAGAFRAGTAAQDADDRIIYDSATGKLYYDADGSGAGTQVLFAQVTAGLGLTNADFHIVG